MCPIVDGMGVNASNTNTQLLDAVGDDTALGKLTLANVETESGGAIINIQRELNSLASFSGKATNQPNNALPTWASNDVGSASDDLRDRADALSAKFNPVSGHKHTGGAGDAPKVSASDLASVPLRGYVIQGSDQLGVTGSSTVVTTAMAGRSPSSGVSSLGVVVSPPSNKIVIRQASGANEDDVFTDGSGNVVYGRITESSGIWTLSYFVKIASVETPYSFSSASDVRWYFQELFNPMISPPTYSEFAAIPSDNATSDVVDATTGLKGKVVLSSVAPGAIAASGSQGTANATVANSDHTHEGLHSIAKSGDTPILGDATLSEGSGIALTQVGQNIQVASTLKIRSGLEAIPNGAESVSVVFTSPMPSISYSLLVSIQNITDSEPQFQPITVTAKSVSGFTAKWNAPMDSASYVLEFIATAHA